MYTAIGYAAQSATTPLAPMSFERRSPRVDDVAIEILYCGLNNKIRLKLVNVCAFSNA